MDNIIVYIIGTTHETQTEEKIFNSLNYFFDNYDSKNTYWLCEGEENKRKCITLKDYKVHVITDSLFVNMMIIDFENNNLNNNDSMYTIFYSRIIELFITVTKLNNNKIKNFFNINNIYILVLEILQKEITPTDI